MPGLLERLFGPPRSAVRDYRSGPKLGGLDPISERAIALQKRYWTANPAERAALEATAFEALSPAQRLRLHHLRCLALLDPMQGGDPVLRRGLLAPVAERPSDAELRAALDPAARAQVEASARALLGRRSLFRPRHGFAWLGAGPPAGDAVPYSDFQGRITNASLTHLGCLEVIGLDQRYEPATLEFLDFDSILTVSFGVDERGDGAAKAGFRPARILLEYGLDDRVVLVPTRYGLSWFAHEPEVLRGAGSWEVAAIELGGLADPSKAVGNALDRRPLGISVGPQRFEVLSDFATDGEGGLSRFVLSDAYQLSLAIDQDDPRFADKCRGRGLDVDATRGDVVRESRLIASARAIRKGS